jgi:hypothetical protein
MEDDKWAYPVIGFILMIAITVVIAAVIGTLMFEVTGVYATTYTTIITVKEIVISPCGIGIIDTDNEGYYWRPNQFYWRPNQFDSTPFIVNGTYLIGYSVYEGDRFIRYKQILETPEDPILSERFKCKPDATGVCK